MQQPVLRKEVVSGQMWPVNQLIRVVKTKQGLICLDVDKTMPGRGAYLAPTLEAIQQVRQKKLLERSLKTKPPLELYQQLETEVAQNWL